MNRVHSPVWIERPVIERRSTDDCLWTLVSLAVAALFPGIEAFVRDGRDGPNLILRNWNIQLSLETEGNQKMGIKKSMECDAAA